MCASIHVCVCPVHICIVCVNPCLFVSVHVYVSICAYCVSLSMFVHPYVCVFVCQYVCVSVHVCVVCLSICVYVHMWVIVYVNICVCLCVVCLSMCICVLYVSIRECVVCLSMFVHLYACASICVCLYVCVVCLCPCVCVSCLYACVHVCMCQCMCMPIHMCIHVCLTMFVCVCPWLCEPVLCVKGKSQAARIHQHQSPMCQCSLWKGTSSQQRLQHACHIHPQPLQGAEPASQPPWGERAHLPGALLPASVLILPCRGWRSWRGPLCRPPSGYSTASPLRILTVGSSGSICAPWSLRSIPGSSPAPALRCSAWYSEQVPLKQPLAAHSPRGRCCCCCCCC